ncbi:zinc finger protein [Aphelenchoides avenae]|nr:zinc finger protein [Aphelenchus avenae]
MAKLREISMRLGGAQYFKKRSTDAVKCEFPSCGKTVKDRLSSHAYAHLDLPLFLCPHCTVGHYCRDMIIRHLKEFHDSSDPATDNRLKFAHEIKDIIRTCYPHFFVDAPVPTQADIEKLKASLKLDDKALLGVADEEEHDNENDAHEDDEDQNDEEEAGDTEHEAMKSDAEEGDEAEDEEEEEEEHQEEEAGEDDPDFEEEDDGEDDGGAEENDEDVEEEDWKAEPKEELAE